MSKALTTLTEISRALAQISSVPEAKDMRDKASAILRYAKESRQSLEVQNRAAYVKLLCERKAGALLLEVPRNSGAGGHRRKDDASVTLTGALRAANIPEPTARRWQYLAKWPEDQLVSLMEACNEDEDELTTSIAVSAARSYLDSLETAKPPRKDSTRREEPAEREEQSEWTEPSTASLDDLVTQDSCETCDPPQEVPDNSIPLPTRVEADRAERLIQLFDAACDLCRDRPAIAGWIPTMHRWKSKLSQMKQEK
jgi:hypothetical protein